MAQEMQHASVGAGQSARAIYQPKVSISDRPDLDQAALRGGKIAGPRKSHNSTFSRMRVEAQLTVYSSLVRARTRSEVLAKTKKGGDIMSRPTWYRTMMQQLIDGKGCVKIGEFVKIRTMGEGKSSHMPAYCFRGTNWAKWNICGIEWEDIAFSKFSEGTFIGPILAVCTSEQPPNMTVWCGLVPSKDTEEGCVVVILGVNFHVAITRTPPGSDKAQRQMVVAGLEAKREHTALTDTEQRIMEKIPQIIANENVKREFDEEDRKGSNGSRSSIDFCVGSLRSCKQS